MQLKFSKTIKKRVITIDLETSNFSTDEGKALDIYGEPEVLFEKTYSGNFSVQFNKKIRTGFKVKVKFDGIDDMTGASNAANSFFEEIQEKLADAMATVMEQYNSSEFVTETGTVTISY